jgi:hypothetical protein
MSLKIDNFVDNFNFTLFSKFLTRHGWKNDGKYNQIITVWHRSEEDKLDYELVVPEENKLKSFYITVKQIIDNLSDFYKKTPDRIIDDFNNSIHDKVKYSIKSDKTRNGFIPLNDGIKLLDETRDFFISSFLAVKEKKKNYLGQRPAVINEILDAIELGQTEEGSFVINLFIPRDYYENGEQELFDNISFTRKALDTMEMAANELLKKIEEYQISEDITVFDESVVKGVSSNFCHAISEMSLNGESDVVINIECYNGIEKEINTREIFIDKDIIPIVDKVVEYYHSDFMEENYSLAGYVTMLHQEEDAIGGEITLATWVEGKRRKVRMELSPNLYIIAVNAHRDRNQVVCQGTLYVKDNILKLLDVKSVLLSEDD